MEIVNLGSQLHVYILSIVPPLTTEGNRESGVGAHIPEALKNEWRALGTGHLSARDSMNGALREGSFTGDPEKYVKQGSEMSVYFHRGPAFGGHGGALLSKGLLI